MTLRSLFVDFNSYFASVEQHEEPSLRGRPVGVVPVLADTTCLIAASYEAKAHGVGTGTLVREARRLCPDLVIRPARPARYVAWHKVLYEAIERAIPIEYAGSIDEVACELVGRQRERAAAEAIARQVKAEIARVAPGGAIRCSIGIAPNAFLAKTASDMVKPDGLTVIEQAELPHALHRLALRDLCGIGPSMERRLNEHRIFTVAQLTAADKHLLRHAWGSIEGERMWGLLRGAWLPQRDSVRASMGHSHVLGPALRTPGGARSVLRKLLVKAAMRLRRDDLLAGALAVRIRFVGHEERYAADLAFDPTDDSRSLLHLLAQALGVPRGLPGPPRATPLSVSVTLYRLVERAQSSGSLFAPPEANRRLDAVIDRINGKFGHNKVYFGGMQEALAHDAAPMRIPFNRIPDADSEQEAELNPLWLERLNQFKAMAEDAHRQPAGRHVPPRRDR
ncbi:DNA polymerase Y family protein [Frateuria defendens]|uniref:DNA polymerase Y family protein n=1 Tax=Frateuria defendens TaxID=2219559 RepID=UPI00066FF7F3|nr:hypothetical protein [Frateuria defendens]